MAKTREERISPEQKNIMLSFMEDHTDFSQGKFSGLEGIKTNLCMWEVLSTQLNSVTGPKKTTKKWQRVWTDLKNKIKTKANNARYEREAAGCNVFEHPVILSDFDERVVAIMSTGYDSKDALISSDSDMAAGPSWRNIRPLKRKHPPQPLVSIPSTSAQPPEPTALDDIMDHDYIASMPSTPDPLFFEPVLEAEKEVESASIRVKRFAGDNVKPFILLNKEINERLVNIEEKVEAGSNTNKEILSELKCMNSFMERIALSLESISNKMK